MEQKGMTFDHDFFSTSFSFALAKSNDNLFDIAFKSKKE